MKNDKYGIKKVIIGSAMGAAVLFGAAGLAKAQTGPKENPGSEAASKPSEISAEAKAKLTSPEQVAEAKSLITLGYIEGLKRGQKDGSHSHKYNAAVQLPDQELTSSSFSLSRNNKPFYEAGYTRGYEDGYNKTTKYGETTGTGSQKGVTIYAKVLDELAGKSE